ncbi:hypothetical protein EMCRGX_G031864 [Ephydatia muelleri]
MAYRTGNLSLSLVRSTQRELLHAVERVAYRSVSVLAGHERRIAGVPRSQTTIQRRQETTSVATDEATFNERKRKERFIPVARRTLIQSMMNEENLLSGKERACVEAFATSLDAVVAQRYYRLMEEVKHLYENLDPDRETIKTKQLSRQELLDAEYWLLQRVGRLLEKANYSEIQKPRLHDLLKTHSTSEGVIVSVNPADYETLRIWVRGKAVLKPSGYFGNKFHRYIWKSSPNPESVYTNVFVAVRSKQERKLYFKVFKEVPCEKLEYLLPDGMIQMSKRDKVLFSTGVTIGGSILAVKLFSLLADVPLHGAWVALGVTGVVGARLWVSYKNKRNQYLLNMSKLLYFKTLANNKGALALLSDRAQDEDFKEAILAYLFLVSPPNRRGIPGAAHTEAPPHIDTPGSLRARIEDWLVRRFGLTSVRFDVEDTLVELESLGLLSRQETGKISVQPIEAALDLLPTPVHHWSAMVFQRDAEDEGEREESKPGPKEPTSDHGWR